MRRNIFNNTSGAALIMVIWVLTALCIVLSEFVFTGRISLNAARNQKLDSAGYYLAMGAFYQALDEIRREYIYLFSGDDSGVIFVRDGEDIPEDMEDTRRSGNIPGTGKYFYQIFDEESKINLNKANRKELLGFLRNMGMSIGAERDTIIDSILDWRDGNNLHLLNGAEDDYYQSLTPPYYAKNGNFDSPEELLLVKGVTPEIFYGMKGHSGRSISEMVTVYGEMTRNKIKLNYNTAAPEVLSAVASQEEADRIVKQRESTPYADDNGRSRYFTIIAEGLAEGARTGRKIKAVVGRKGPHDRPADVNFLHWNDLYIEPPRESEDER